MAKYQYAALLSTGLMAACLAVTPGLESTTGAANQDAQASRSVSQSRTISKKPPVQGGHGAVDQRINSRAPAWQGKRQESIQRPTNSPAPLVKNGSAAGGRRLKTTKHILPKAIVVPREEAVSHGLLEDPRRYDPRPNDRASGIPDPGMPGLIHDHFQELDRNQDGRVDPVERAFGRLDMDKDLPSRHY